MNQYGLCRAPLVCQIRLEAQLKHRPFCVNRFHVQMCRNSCVTTFPNYASVVCPSKSSMGFLFERDSWEKKF